ncbi:MAG: RNA polymerase sigma factor [Acidobacteriota bacterium]
MNKRGDSASSNDHNLVEKALQGERKAFEMIVRKYQTPLLNYIGRMVGNRELALDMTQDVFLKIHTALSQYKPEYKFSTWLFKITRNHVIDYWRKKKIKAFSTDQEENHLFSKEIPADDPPLCRTMELTEIREKIEAALEKLPTSLRELFVWRHINELSYEEIAEIKDLPLGTVKNRVFQAKEMLRHLIGEI